MIDKYKTILNKTTELEDKLNEITQNDQKLKNSTNCLCFDRHLTNFSVLTKSKILITKVEVEKLSSLYLQMSIDLTLNSEQQVIFSIIVDNISIHKTTKLLSTGFNQITLMKSYTPLQTSQSNIYLEITPIEGKQLLVQNISLAIWGLFENKKIKYQALELENEFLLAYLNNNNLFYLKQPKVESINNAEDFTLLKSAKSFSFNYFTNTLYLFRVDQAGRLFYSDFYDGNEKLITTDVSEVSTASNENTILVSFIKNSRCYFVEFYNKSFSCEKQIDCLNATLIDTYCYYNAFSKKFYIIMTDKNKSNYLIESTNESASLSENISASVGLTISTYSNEENI